MQQKQVRKLSSHLYFIFFRKEISIGTHVGTSSCRESVYDTSLRCLSTRDVCSTNRVLYLEEEERKKHAFRFCENRGQLARPPRQ